MLDNAREFLGTRIDNSSLVFFRFCYGFLIAAESYGAILTGWVDRTLIQPKFTFSYIGLEWLQPLSGDGMYYYFILMGTCGLLVMIGLFYRTATTLFFILWTGTYFMQKTAYNNHYYLLILLGAVMIFMPAHRSRSLDVKWGFVKESKTCLNVHIWFFILLIGLVYVIASLNKIHWDWILAKPIGIWFGYKSNYWLIGPLLAQEWFQYAISWGGILYDGTIVFLLLYKRTRKLGFFLSIFFNLFNSAVFQIGIFPYLMIAFTVFFYPPEYVRSALFRDKTIVPSESGKLSQPVFYLLVCFFVVQLWLPLRHHFYEGDVHWTEEGHKMAWQMMLRAKSGTAKFDVVDKATGEKERVNSSKHLTARQRTRLSGSPDMIWQYAQYLKQEYQKEGKDVEVYVESSVSLNRNKRVPLIDPNTDLASVPWDRWKHSDWILTYDTYD